CHNYTPLRKYEAETNLIIHAGGGEMMAEIQPHQIRIVGTDRGPGISDIDQAMQVGFSTAPEWIREQGFGAGMGLANIKKCADIMNLKSTVGEGTTIEIIVGLS
ncbi:MAG: anti-sigma regulatory factor, partial [Chloroflexi bacterium]|nr:anti-sigma regulatory factor [Chloroflexota bacterium]